VVSQATKVSWSGQGGKWHPEKPYGMTLVPGGAFIMGKSDDDVLQYKTLN
jgi:hypothetical protein